MALGQLASLGLGSSGVLNWDTLNSLKDYELKQQLNPITTKIQANLSKQSELSSLLVQMSSLNSSFKSLSDYSTFQRRSVSVEGSGIKATAGDGLAIQDITLKVSQLAQNDVNQVGLKFAARDSVFSRENTTLNFYHDGTNYNIDIKAGMTLEEVAQSITDATDGKVLGIIMKTGGDEPYQLMIQGKDTGAASKIYFGSTLESAAVPGGEIKDGGTIRITIGGEMIEVSTDDIDSKLGNTSEQNAKAILEAIQNKIDSDPSLSNLKDKIESGEITIGLKTDGKGLMLNDSKGGKIQVELTDVKIQAAQGVSDVESDLGFAQKTSASQDLVTGSSAVSSKSLSGILKINGVDIDLSGINQGSDNAQAVADAINAAFSNGEITASVQNGRLVLNSNDGSDITISADDSNGEKADILKSVGLTEGTYTSTASILEKLDIKNIQTAQDAILSYNGTIIQRDKNTIDDIVSGLSLELTAVTEADKSVTVRVSRNDSGLSDIVQEMVNNYNAIFNKIAELTKYDEDTKIAGVFNGSSEMRTIMKELNSLLSSNDIHGNNLVAFGITFNENGTLAFDRTKFEEAYKKDPDAAISYFRSTTSVIRGQETEVDGVFTKLQKTMDSFITGSSSLLKALETSLTNESKKLTEEQTRTQERIDTRYETLAEKWSAYDQMLAQIQNKMNTVTNMINAFNNSNN